MGCCGNPGHSTLHIPVDVHTPVTSSPLRRDVPNPGLHPLSLPGAGLFILNCLPENVPHRVKEIETRRKFIPFFFFFFSPENCFSLISYCVFSDPTNELMSCYCRSLGIKVNKQIWLQSMSKEGCAFFTLDKESKIQSKLYWLSAQAWSPFSLSWDNFVRSEPKFCPFLMLSIHPKRNTGCMHAEYSMYKVSSFLLNKLLNFLLFS